MDANAIRYIAIQYGVPRKGLPASASVRGWIESALMRPAALTIRFVGAREGRRLNRDYRDKDYATNVLTFVYDIVDGALSGDIVLCAPVVAREAREQRKPLRAHYAHLVVHGTLHLQGYDHERDADARKMEKREIAILKRLGFADPYVDTAFNGRRQQP